MPYIKQHMRLQIEPTINDLLHAIDLLCTDYDGTNEKINYDQLDGVLNYTITRLLKHFYIDGLDAGGIPITNYARLNRAVGVVECTKSEFIRRVVTPYEKQKEMENGDVQ